MKDNITTLLAPQSFPMQLACIARYCHMLKRASGREEILTFTNELILRLKGCMS